MTSTPLEDYALIGDCETAALVSRNGSIDWLCWPRFDSAACFAALLGTSEHGRWLIEPVSADAHRSRRYRHNTLILETRIETAEGAATVKANILNEAKLNGSGPATIALTGGPACTARVSGSVTVSGCR